MKETHGDFTDFLERLRAKPPCLEESAACDESAHMRLTLMSSLHLASSGRRLLHTPMLAYLLDPSAAHGQRHLFLKHFFAMLHLRHGLKLPEELIEVGEWTVETQVSVGRFGRLDVLIENLKLHCVIVIENKIGIEDHDDQLRKSRRWLRTWRNGYDCHLFYLTPDGRCPTEKDDGDCRCLSYKDDVMAFGVCIDAGESSARSRTRDTVFLNVEELRSA